MLKQVVLFEPDKRIAKGLVTALVTHGLDVLNRADNVTDKQTCLLLLRANQLDKLPEQLSGLPMVILGKPKGEYNALAVLDEKTPMPALALELIQLYSGLRQ